MGGVAYGRGRTLDGTVVDFAGEPQALEPICAVLNSGGGPVLAAIPRWWSVLRRQLDARPASSGADLAEWLRAQMLARRLSQRQVARRAGVDHSTVSRVLAGRAPTVATLDRLAAVVGWPPFEALDRPSIVREPTSKSG